MGCTSDADRTVDSTIRNGCFHPILVSASKDVKRPRYTVLDGWQRLSVLRDFHESRLPWCSRTGNLVTFGAPQLEIEGPSRRMAATERQAFLEAQVTLVVYSDLPTHKQRDLFLRIHHAKSLDAHDKAKVRRGPFGTWLAEHAATLNGGDDNAGRKKSRSRRA